MKASKTVIHSAPLSKPIPKKEVPKTTVMNPQLKSGFGIPYICVRCPVCDGRMFTDGQLCGSCNGDGRLLI